MSVIAFIIIVLVIGLVVGGIARFLLPGPDPMGLLETAAIGVLGSIIAGIVSLELWGRGAGILLSIAVSMILVYLVRLTRGGGVGRRSRSRY